MLAIGILLSALSVTAPTFGGPEHAAQPATPPVTAAPVQPQDPQAAHQGPELKASPDVPPPDRAGEKRKLFDRLVLYWLLNAHASKAQR
jgi:hypothetical protein